MARGSRRSEPDAKDRKAEEGTPQEGGSAEEEAGAARGDAPSPGQGGLGGDYGQYGRHGYGSRHGGEYGQLHGGRIPAPDETGDASSWPEAWDKPPKPRPAPRPRPDLEEADPDQPDPED